ncbi:hypothetical protein QFC22_006126 [Naganishia vaughanmartiniae]|uniref:Uncharacterized protein n=1 Tax=Naganishia vaughanmartiniae TaxID=1424756 RepID=A0ACC2WNX1_9TREE|nr:hypothetical protein QFC22_006126 [Naganishia vaughanmartiniae]
MHDIHITPPPLRHASPRLASPRLAFPALRLTRIATPFRPLAYVRRLAALLLRYLQPPERPGGPARLLIPATALRELVDAGVLDRGILRSLASRPGGGDDDDDGDDGGSDDDEDEDSDDGISGNPFFNRRRRPLQRSRLARNGRLKGWHWFPLEREGNQVGRALARSGEFGKAGWPGAELRSGVAGGEQGLGKSRCSEGESALVTSPVASTGSMRLSTAGNVGLAVSPTSPTARRRASSVSSVKSVLTGAQERIKGVKRDVAGRGKWVNGMVGFGRGWGRGVWGRSGFEEWNRECLPNTNGTIVATYDAPPYIGQYSRDYSFFYTANQAFQLDLYSTQVAPRKQPEEAVTGAPRPNVRARRSAFHDFGDDDDDDEPHNDHSIHKIKTVQGVYGQWTVTDADLSRDNEWMIYSSITPHVHLLRTAEHDDEHTLLDFAATGASARRDGRHWGSGGNFGIWSIRFSADQREIVAGASSGQIMVYDVEARQRILNVYGHDDDVNGVCFADESSTNVLVSASDDGYLKVWDRRSLASKEPSGVLCGHTEGITHCSPKGDGRYVISNGKDQALRLWDLRQMRSQRDILHDESASIRPIESTGGQYLYTGGSNGIIYIYALDGRVVQVLDRTKAQPLKTPDGAYTDPSAPSPVPEFDPDPHGNDTCTVRDVSWNGLEPSMISTAWSRDRRGGDLAIHQWKGLGKGGLNRLEDWVEMNEANERG